MNFSGIGGGPWGTADSGGPPWRPRPGIDPNDGGGATGAGGGFGWKRNGLRAMSSGAGGGVFNFAIFTSSAAGSAPAAPLTGVSATGLDVEPDAVADGHCHHTINASTAAPSAITSDGRTPERRSAAITRSEVGRHLDLHREAALRLLVARERHVFQDDELGRRFERINEPADVAILARVDVAGRPLEHAAGAVEAGPVAEAATLSSNRASRKAFGPTPIASCWGRRSPIWSTTP